MKFSDLNLNPDLARGVAEAGYETCMPVQELVFRDAFQGRDICAQSQTGTGKTAAFLISVYQRMMTESSLRNRKALILAPTRELAVQIEGEAKKLGAHLPIFSGAFYGGVGYGPQRDMLRDGVQIIIGTPGRIIDLVNQGTMLLRDVGFLVIDEADRMFDMGFIDDLRRLIRYLPSPDQRQTFLFSATLSLKVKELAWEYMRDPVQVEIEPERITVDLVTQELYHVGAHEKLPLLLGIMAREKPESALIFCNQKAMVEELAKRLGINGIECEYIIGDLPQAQRLRVIERLKSGTLKLLVATDVAARGLDVEGLDLVINYDLPEDPESYVHRIGRTARAGKSGMAVSLACERFVYGLPAIESYIGSKIPVKKIEDALLLEDKSASMRFRSERGYGRGGARTQGGERGRTQRAGTQRRAGEGRASGRRTGEGAVLRRSAEKTATEKSRAPRPSGHPKSEGQAANSPYELTQEERMRRYKSKYRQASEAEGGAKKSAPKSSARSKDESAARQPERAARSAKKSPTSTRTPAARTEASARPAKRGAASDKERASRQPRQSGVRPEAQSSAVGGEKKAAKKGILAALKRLIKGKDQSA